MAWLKISNISERTDHTPLLKVIPTQVLKPGNDFLDQVLGLVIDRAEKTTWFPHPLQRLRWLYLRSLVLDAQIRCQKELNRRQSQQNSQNSSSARK